MKIKDLVIFFGGFSLGLSLGYFLAKTKLEAKLNDDLNREVEALHKKYRSEVLDIVNNTNSENIKRAKESANE